MDDREGDDVEASFFEEILDALKDLEKDKILDVNGVQCDFCAFQSWGGKGRGSRLFHGDFLKWAAVPKLT